MDVKIIKCLQDNYSYIIVDEKNQIACVVDPSEAQPIINFVEEKKIYLKYIHTIIMIILVEIKNSKKNIILKLLDLKKIEIAFQELTNL